jgi:hypothetical protein
LRPENISFTRNFLYLAGTLFGFAIGLLFSAHSKRLRQSQKERRVTTGLYVLSAVIAAAATAIVLSGGIVIYDGALLIATCCAAVIGFLSALFPVTFLFPLVILGGFLIVLTSILK